MNQQTQEQVKESDDFPIKAWLIRKAGQYFDGIFINGLSALIFGGFLWLAQHFWGLRLIPFNVLDAILLALVLMIVFLLLLALLAYLLLRHFLNKHPELVFGLVIGFFATIVGMHVIAKSKENNEKGIENTFANIFPDIIKPTKGDAGKNPASRPDSK